MTLLKGCLNLLNY